MKKCPYGKALALRALSTYLGLFGLNAARVAVLTIVALALSPVASFAQSNAEGYIYGSVSGATTVTAVNVGNGLTRTVTVSADGSFTVSSLPVGIYNVTAKKGSDVVQTEDGVSVNLGAGTSVRFGGAIELDKFVVGGSSFSQIDTSQTGASLQIRKEIVDVLPISRDLASVMNVAPSVTKGDAAFGNSPSFAGASVAENNVYINGFNVTNFRNGLGFSEVPFDFYETFQVLVGGYGPEYGRSTGGVTNATTKSGTNQYKAGANFYYNPSGLRNTQPDTYAADGTLVADRGDTSIEDKEANIYAGFPIVKNHLFFYGIYNFHKYEASYAQLSGTQWAKRNSDNPFWGFKVDYNLNDNHRLEYTKFSDSNKIYEELFPYTFATKTIGTSQGVTTYFSGGKNEILRYSGNFGENFDLKLLYGKGGYNLTVAGAGDSAPAIYDGRSGVLIPLGTWTTLQPGTDEDTRKAYRVDATWRLGKLGALGDHSLKFGGDLEDNVANSNIFYSGHAYYRYYTATASTPTPNIGRVRVRHYEVGGSFKVKNTAYYVQDDVSLMNDKLKLSLGLRSEGFKNYNKDGKVFIEAKNQYAPRISASYDPTGEGKAKIYANWGLYYLPIAANTNVRASGGELFDEQFFTLLGINADGTPQIGAATSAKSIFSNGIAPDPSTLSALDLKPMYQSELILGGQIRVAKNWLLSLRFTARNLESTIDDTHVPQAIDRWAARTGKPAFTPDSDYVLFNPGRDLTFMADIDGNGTYEPVTLTKADLGFSDGAIRKYYAITFEAERDFVNNWFLRGSYTWSQNYGNFEGWVKSENEQDDAGLTLAWDEVEFMNNSYGRLPNDRRHVFKAQGGYRLTPEFTIGGTALLQSGRPLNKLGSPYLSSGGDSGVFMVPRGTAGTTSWLKRIDLAFTYQPTAFKKRLTFGLDVINIFNWTAAEKLNESYEDATHAPLISYNLVRTYQPARRMQVSMSYDY